MIPVSKIVIEGVSFAAPPCHGCALRSRVFVYAGYVTCIGQPELLGARGTRAFAQEPRVANAAVSLCCVVLSPGKTADEVAVRCSDTHLETAVVAERDDFLVAFGELRVGRSQDAAGPPRSLDGQAQHVGVPARGVGERGSRLAARILSVGRRLLDRQRGAEIRQHDGVMDALVREHARRSRELVRTGDERGRVLEVEQLGERGRAFTGMVADPQRDGQIGRDRRQFDRDAGDFVALAVIAQRESH